MSSSTPPTPNDSEREIRTVMRLHYFNTIRTYCATVGTLPKTRFVTIFARPAAARLLAPPALARTNPPNRPKDPSKRPKPERTNA